MPDGWVHLISDKAKIWKLYQTFLAPLQSQFQNENVEVESYRTCPKSATLANRPGGDSG
jgi:hypothetical protein